MITGQPVTESLLRSRALCADTKFPGVLENMKRKVEIEREVKALRSSTTNSASTPEDAVSEARKRKVAYDVFLELLAAGKVQPIKDGDSLTILVQDLSEEDMKAFIKAKGYLHEQPGPSDPAPRIDDGPATDRNAEPQ